MAEQWVTDEDLKAATARFAAGIAGYVHPAAYSVARRDGDELTFSELNGYGNERKLPAVVLAATAGYTNTSLVAELSTAEFQHVVDLLAPADAAVHMNHPNLWSWRSLLADGGPDSSYVAVFVADENDLPVDDVGARFHELLRSAAGE